MKRMDHNPPPWTRALAAALLVSAPAWSGSLHDSLNTSVQIIGTVSSFTPTNLSAGPYDPGSPSTVVGTLVIEGSPGLAYSIAIDLGLHSASGDCSDPQRRLSNGNGDFLSYTLSDGLNAWDWGCEPGVNMFEDVSSGEQFDRPYEATIPGGQPVGSGVFSDTITATISF